MKKKIGFCFLIYDEIFNQKLWKSFFKNIPENEYGIYIHSKKKILKDLHNSKNYVNIIETKWGHISLVEATHFIFRQAYLDNCDYLLLLSGDTIPIGNFHYIKNHLNLSRFSIQPKKFNTEKQNNFNSKVYNKLGKQIKNNISFKNFQKQNMFFGITKKNYEKIYDVKNKICLFKNCFCPDEYYFINIFILLNLKYEDNYIFVNNDSKSKTQAKLFNYDKIKFKCIKDNNFLFVRKIRKIPSDFRIKYLF